MSRMDLSGFRPCGATGIRRGEMVRPRLDELDFDTENLLICEKKQTRGLLTT